ncbi:MAG: cysteine-rich CWC family protein [Candidatus Accumulibacter sp.]|nr:cysteine-rich CWC family protein [Accumulibacter sp.]
MASEDNGEKPNVVCPRCGCRFACGMTHGLRECWCAKRPILPLEAGEGEHCLCPECFDRLLSERTSPGA